MKITIEADSLDKIRQAITPLVEASPFTAQVMDAPKGQRWDLGRWRRTVMTVLDDNSCAIALPPDVVIGMNDHLEIRKCDDPTVNAFEFRVLSPVKT